MSIHFYYFSMIIFIFTYLCTIIFKNHYLKYFKKIREKLSAHLKKSEELKINSLYMIILLLTVIWITIIYFYQKYAPYSTTVFLKKNDLLYKIGIPIFFFLFGLLASHGKMILHYYLKEPIYITKTLILTGNYILLFYFLYCGSKMMIIIIASIYLIFIINYFLDFRKKINQLNNKEFIIQFIWLLWIYFCTNFILIYQLINQ